MPFCRKCGRRLREYSESCPECNTSTTAPLIKIKKITKKNTVSSTAKATSLKKVAKAVIPATATVSVKVITPTKAAKAIVPAKATVITKPIPPAKPFSPLKPVTPAVVYPPHEIKKSNVSLKEDFIANPNDYETQTFSFSLKCPNEHFWRAGKALPVSNGKALCPQCGEKLRKPKPKNNRRQSYRRPKF